MKINVFKSMAENISRLLSSNKQTPEEKMITEKFIEFLNVEDCLFCYKMMDEGFDPPTNLKSKLNTLMLDKTEKGYYSYESIQNIKNIDSKTRLLVYLKYMDMSTENYDFFNIYPKYENSHSDKQVIDFLDEEQNKNIVYQYIHESLIALKDHYVSHVDTFGNYYGGKNEKLTKKNNHLMYIVGVGIRHEIFSKEQTQSIRELFENFDVSLNKKTKDNHVSFSKIDKIYFDTFLESLKQYQAHQLGSNNNKENVLRQIKSFKARQKTLKEEINHLVVNEEYSVENLPPEAKTKVNSLTDLVNKMDNEEVSNFVQERLPVILKRYFSIDEEYRTELKNVEGFNAQELMMQSLDNIERIVKAKQHDNNYDLLSELSVENRKLKAKV